MNIMKEKGSVGLLPLLKAKDEKKWKEMQEAYPSRCAIR